MNATRSSTGLYDATPQHAPLRDSYSTCTSAVSALTRSIRVPSNTLPAGSLRTSYTTHRPSGDHTPAFVRMCPCAARVNWRSISRGDRQADGELGALADAVAVYRHLAAVQFHQAAHQRQADAQAVARAVQRPRLL